MDLLRTPAGIREVVGSNFVFVLHPFSLRARSSKLESDEVSDWQQAKRYTRRTPTNITRAYKYLESPGMVEDSQDGRKILSSESDAVGQCKLQIETMHGAKILFSEVAESEQVHLKQHNS